MEQNMFRGAGTLIDVGVIITSGLLGLIIGKKLKENVPEALIKIIGLICIINGVQMALEAVNFLQVLIGLLLGVGVGETLQLEEKVNSKLLKQTNKGFTKALITATLISLVGPLAILGPIQEGINGDLRLILLKTGFDSISSSVLAASLGIGVIFSALPILIFQGLLTLFGQGISSLINGLVMSQITGVGGIIVLAVGLKVLKIKEFKVINMLPAFLTVLLITLIMK